MPMRVFPLLLVLASALAQAHAATANPATGSPKPSRPADKGCMWERLGDATLGLRAWVERCDYGFRKVDLYVAQKSVMQRYSDGGAPSALIEVIDLQPGESPRAGIQRSYAAHTDAAVAARCTLVPYRDVGSHPPAGVQRYQFAPDKAYRKELDAGAAPGEIGEPACGDYGAMPDGVQYYEAQPGSKASHVLFVRAGQDTPLFDENTLQLLP